MRCNAESTRSALKYLSATKPTKKGANTAPRDCVAKIFATSIPEALSDLMRYVPKVTNQAPLIKYSKNIIRDNWTRNTGFID